MIRLPLLSVVSQSAQPEITSPAARDAFSESCSESNGAGQEGESAEKLKDLIGAISKAVFR
jgi:hypothetical protein